MKNADFLQDKIGRDPGFRVPDGYFEDFTIKTMESLPPYPEQPKPVRLTAWQRVKPYVYMAAMFAGIWLTMKMFHDVSTAASRLSLDNPPEAVAYAMASYDGPETSYMYDDNLNDYELMKEVGEEYASMDAFEDAFGYELQEEYDRGE